MADDGFAVREVPQGEAAPMDADAARAWRARRLGRVRIPGAGADERGHDGPVPQEDAGRGTTQGRLHDQARRGVLLQCLFDRFGSVFPQCGLMVFPGVVIVSR